VEYKGGRLEKDYVNWLKH
jgi:hypothetical protein